MSVSDEEFTQLQDDYAVLVAKYDKLCGLTEAAGIQLLGIADTIAYDDSHNVLVRVARRLEHSAHARFIVLDVREIGLLLRGGVV